MSVVIGLPVYNGEKYILDAINSLLSQTHRDFELIISDNASTDQTEELCTAAASKDDRIKYYRNATNIGPVKNFNKIVKFASRKYFKWAAHDDTYAPKYLEKCLAALEEDRNIVLCTSRTRIIGDHGESIRDYSSNLPLDDHLVERRFRGALENFMCYEVFGVMRSDALKKTPLLGSFGHADGILLSWLSLQGRIHIVPEYLYFNRIHAEKSMNYYKNYRDYTVWLDPSKAGKIMLPRWRMGYEYVRAVLGTDIGFANRIKCIFQMTYWLRLFWKSLIANVVVAGGQLIAWPVTKIAGLRKQ